MTHRTRWLWVLLGVSVVLAVVAHGCNARDSEADARSRGWAEGVAAGRVC